MIDFSKLCGPNHAKQRAESTRVIESLFNMPDRFLARRLLTLAREARAKIQQSENFMHDPRYGVYETSFLWSLVPELAYRLGETDFQLNERSDFDLRNETTEEFRMSVGTFLKHTSLTRYIDWEAITPDACYILNHDHVNGNPIAFAIDRLCPPTRESNDWVAKHMREISRARFGDQHAHPIWTPSFMKYRNTMAA